MNGNKILAALSYFSVLFAPILFPIIVWIVGDAETKPHAKRALWTHIIPSIATFIGVAILGIMGIGSGPTRCNTWNWSNDCLSYLRNHQLILLHLEHCKRN